MLLIDNNKVLVFQNMSTIGQPKKSVVSWRLLLVGPSNF